MAYENLAPTPCLQPSCNNYAQHQGRCLEHYTPWAGSNRKLELPKDWQTRRLIVLKRDNYICYICGGDKADRVDHIVPGNDHSLENLAAVHDSIPPHCHRYKSSREGQEAQRLNRLKKR
jgi:5-methylcytosine-specific restriction endonuclease McrA